MKNKPTCGEGIPTPAKTSRQEAHRDRMRASGLAPYQAWVTAWEKDKLVAFLNALRNR